LGLTTAQVHEPTDIKLAIEAFAGTPNGGMIVLPSQSTLEHRKLIATLAAEHRIPTISAFRYFALSGGLMAYGPDTSDLSRRAASYVDRILKGTKPADLPVQHPVKFNLVVNLKTATALGIEVPLQIQQLADEVIE
jgi:putative ABC transport system substrate-binding protein